MKFQFSRNELVAFSLIAAFLFLFFSPVVSGDGFGYYALLEAIGRDGTLNLENQQRFNEVSGKPYVVFNEATGKFVSHYAPGPALFSLPLYLFSMQLAAFPQFHIADEFFVVERGAPLVNQLAFILTALIFAIIALFFSFKIVKQYYGESALLALLLAFFGTPLLWYASADLSYSHAFEAGLMALLLYSILKKPDARLQGIFLGLLTITRYTSALFALPLIIFYLLKGRKKDAATLVGFFAPFAIFLMLYFQFQFGSPLSAGFHEKAVFDSFFPVHILEVLFDLNQGILLWTPLVIAGIVGLWFFSREKRLLLLSFVGLNFWVYSAWSGWHSGWSFGNRFVIILFPLIVLGIAALLSKKPRLKMPLVLLAVYTFIVFLLFAASTGVIPDPFNLLSLFSYWFVEGNLAQLLPLLLEKISIVRAISLF